jgi:hypothetical protein
MAERGCMMALRPLPRHIGGLSGRFAGTTVTVAIGAHVRIRGIEGMSGTAVCLDGVCGRNALTGKDVGTSRRHAPVRRVLTSPMGACDAASAVGVVIVAGVIDSSPRGDRAVRESPAHAVRDFRAVALNAHLPVAVRAQGLLPRPTFVRSPPVDLRPVAILDGASGTGQLRDGFGRSRTPLRPSHVKDDTSSRLVKTQIHDQTPPLPAWLLPAQEATQ